MMIDARMLSSDAALDAAVCVVGAGPLGIAVSVALADAGLDVLQLESGGVDFRPEVAGLDDVAAIEFGGVTSLGNTRQLGGNANAWQVRNGISQRGVRMLPLTDADLEGNSGQPGSRWPFGIDELRPYLDRAQDFFLLPRSGYGADAWADEDHRGQLVDDPDIRTNVFEFPEGGELVKRSAEAIRVHPRIRLLHGATALEVLTDADAAATGVRVASAPGREFTVRAKQVVLAAGAPATTQLLLASDVARPGGLGNSSGLLGRYFMDHLLIRGGILLPEARADLDNRDFYDIRIVNGVPVMGHLQLSDEALRRGDLLNLSFVMLPRGPVRATLPSPRQAAGIHAALTLREDLIRHRPPSRRVLADLARGLDGAVAKQLRSLRHPEASLGRGGWSSLGGRPSQRYTHFEVMHQAEQAPHHDNRLTLSDERNALGLRKLVIDWRWHDEDALATVRAQETFARALKRIGWGDFQIASADGRPVVHSHSSNHFMGTTRMSRSPEGGVVDERGAVHGTPNLYVASSSVFPSGGFANVTLSAVAMALRTADAVIGDAAPITIEDAVIHAVSPTPGPHEPRDARRSRAHRSRRGTES